MIRWLCIGLALALFMPAQAQETLRPIARDVTPAMRPLARPIERPDLAIGLQTRPWMRAEIGMWGRPAGTVILPGSVKPVIRHIARGTTEATVVATAMRPRARPYLRPDLAFGAATRPIFRAEVGLFAFSPTAIAQSQRPNPRPASIEAAAEERRLARLRGQVCGDPAIQGDTIGRVNGRGACGIEEAVRVRSVAGVTLNPRATMDCRTASALTKWVETGVIPAVGNEDGGVAGLRVVSHYACRTRNNQPGARLSEHAFGRAIDIAGIRLKSGREMTLLTDWNSARDGAQLRQMWRAACGPFGTVLGPEANRFHRDHFHFDTARYRSGPYCR